MIGIWNKYIIKGMTVMRLTKNYAKTRRTKMHYLDE